MSSHTALLTSKASIQTYLLYSCHHWHLQGKWYVKAVINTSVYLLDYVFRIPRNFWMLLFNNVALYRLFLGHFQLWLLELCVHYSAKSMNLILNVEHGWYIGLHTICKIQTLSSETFTVGQALEFRLLEREHWQLEASVDASTFWIQLQPAQIFNNIWFNTLVCTPSVRSRLYHPRLPHLNKLWNLDY